MSAPSTYLLNHLVVDAGTNVSIYRRQKAVAAERASENGAKKSRLDLQSLPTRQYLDQTVVPALQQALSVLSKERSVPVAAARAGTIESMSIPESVRL